MNPQISLVIPTYNAQIFVGETLESVWSQTLSISYFETIIVDDGSRDETIESVRKNIQGRENVQFYSRRRNKGAAVTRNEAIEMSSGRYIVPLDSDDLLEPNSLESTLAFMLRNSLVEYSYSRHKRIDENGEFICDRPGYEFSRERLRHFNFVGALTCFTRDIHNRVGGYDERVTYGHDWDHVLRAAEVLEEDQIAQNPEYLYRYRIHKESISLSKSEQRKKFIERFLAEHLFRSGLDVEVFWSYLTEDGYNYFDWRNKRYQCASSYNSSESPFDSAIRKSLDLEKKE